MVIVKYIIMEKYIFTKIQIFTSNKKLQKGVVNAQNMDQFDFANLCSIMNYFWMQTNLF